MKTIQDMLDWIRDNVDLEAIGQESPESALCWFVAMHEVTNDHEGNTTKDWALLLLDGHPGIDIDYCKNWLEWQIEVAEEERQIEMAEDDDDEDLGLEGQLADFFG